MNKQVEKIAYAKINLALDVTGRLDNGYHTVRMIMESVSLYDKLTITVSDIVGVRMTCNRADLSCGEDNLVIRAAKAILQDREIGLDIHLEKNIPMAAGMAGGSTDAAAVLKGINELLGLGYSDEKLCEIGVKLGADIPYCILGGSRLAEGIGEILTEVPNPPQMYLAIIKPNMDVSTKFVYEHLDTEGAEEHPDVDGMIEAMRASDMSGMCSRLGNVLRDVTVTRYPVISKLEEYLIEKGAMNALMSGSGPTVFGLFEDKEIALAAVKEAKREYPDMFVQEAEFIL